MLSLGFSTKFVPNSKLEGVVSFRMRKSRDAKTEFAFNYRALFFQLLIWKGKFIAKVALDGATFIH